VIHLLSTKNDKKTGRTIMAPIAVVNRTSDTSMPKNIMGVKLEKAKTRSPDTSDNVVSKIGLPAICSVFTRILCGSLCFALLCLLNWIIR